MGFVPKTKSSARCWYQAHEWHGTLQELLVLIHAGMDSRAADRVKPAAAGK